MSWVQGDEIAADSFTGKDESVSWTGTVIISGHYITRLVHSGFVVESET